MAEIRQVFGIFTASRLTLGCNHIGLLSVFQSSHSPFPNLSLPRALSPRPTPSHPSGLSWFFRCSVEPPWPLHIVLLNRAAHSTLWVSLPNTHSFCHYGLMSVSHFLRRGRLSALPYMEDTSMSPATTWCLTQSICWISVYWMNEWALDKTDPRSDEPQHPSFASASLSSHCLPWCCSLNQVWCAASSCISYSQRF